MDDELLAIYKQLRIINYVIRRFFIIFELLSENN